MSEEKKDQELAFSSETKGSNYTKPSKPDPIFRKYLRKSGLAIPVHVKVGKPRSSC